MYILLLICKIALVVGVFLSVIGYFMVKPSSKYVLVNWFCRHHFKFLYAGYFVTIFGGTGLAWIISVR